MLTLGGTRIPWGVRRPEDGLSHGKGQSQRVIEGGRPGGSLAIGAQSRVRINPTAAMGNLEGHALEPGVVRGIIDRKDNGIIGAWSWGARLDGPSQAIIEGARLHCIILLGSAICLETWRDDRRG